MTFNKEDVLAQEQIEEICQKYPTEELQARELLKLDIRPEQMWLLYRKIRSFEIYKLVKESDLFNLMSDFVDRMTFLSEEERKRVIDSRVDLLLSIYKDKQLVAEKEQKPKKKGDHSSETIAELEDISETSGINIEQAVIALRIERLGESFSQLESLEDDTKRCERAIALCEELIETYKDRISSNKQKKEQLKKSRDETRKR